MSSFPPSTLSLAQDIASLQVQLSNLRDEVRAPDVQPGIPMRDWFAGQALGALISSSVGHPDNLKATLRDYPEARLWVEHTAQTAYTLADAMLEARAVIPEGNP